MRCKPDVASPTGCRAASCRFLSFSVVFLPFRPAFLAVRSSCLPRRPLLLSSPPSAPPVFSADRSSRLPRRPLLLSSPPSALVFSAVRSCLLRRPLFPFSARPPAPAHYIIILLCALPKCALPGTAPFRVLSFASPAPLPSRASSLPRLARAPSAPRFRLLATYFSVIGLTESEIFP